MILKIELKNVNWFNGSSDEIKAVGMRARKEKFGRTVMTIFSDEY